jgi:hypothetical protein
MATYGSTSALRTDRKVPTLHTEQSSPTWHTNLATRSPPMTKHVEKKRAKPTSAAIFDFPVSDEEETPKPIRKSKPAITKDPFDFPSSGEEKKQKAKLQQPVKRKIAKGDNNDKKILNPSVPKPSSHARSKSAQVLSKPTPLVKRKRKHTEDVHESDQGKVQLPKTPARQTHKSLPSESHDIYDFPEKESPKKAKAPNKTKRATSEAPSNTSRASRASSRARATKSPAPSIKSRAIRSKATRAEPSIVTKSRSALEPLGLMVSTSPTSLHSPFETPSPKEPRTPRPLLPAESITPRQSALWNKLLQDEDDFSAPSINRLQLNSISKRGSGRDSPLDSGLPAKRVKLITSLKTSHPINEEDEDDLSSDQSSDQDSEDDTTIHAIQPTATSSQLHAAPRIKYGQQRSYVETNTEEAMFDFLMEDVTVTADAKKPSDDFDFGLESEEEASQPRTVHELKAAGSKRRILSELEHMVEGVQGDGLTSLSAQRSELLELTGKLMDPNTVSLLLDHGLDRRLMDAIGKSDDEILHFIAAICLTLIIDGCTNITVLRHVRKSGCLTQIAHLLSVSKDISKLVKERKFNMSRIAQTSIVEFKSQIQSTSNWSNLSSSAVSPQIAAIVVMEKLVRKTRESGSDEAILGEKIIIQLLSILEMIQLSTESTPLAHRIFSCLESSSIGAQEIGRNPWSNSTLEKLATLLPSVLDTKSVVEISVEFRFLALRLLLNITNNNSKACDTFAVPSLVVSLMTRINLGFGMLAQISEDKVIMDELILSLGAMINLVELSDTARIQVLGDGGEVLKMAVEIFHGKKHTMLEVSQFIPVND